MAVGTVKWFNATKGFGFIAPDGGAKTLRSPVGDFKRRATASCSKANGLS